MNLVTCPNCRCAYGDVQRACPHCEATPEGEGAAVEFDGATRTVLAALGGVYGGILETPDGNHALWCARGVCVFSEEMGLVWQVPLPGRVDEVGFGEGTVSVRVRGRTFDLRLSDGADVDDSA